jgi:demethylmenaquinone methyltransferase/2-methoxy-6-polyprenyl-1,4-benzoquinol methylase
MSDPRSTTAHLESYYAKRAREYEQVYEKPERQRELAWLRERIPRLFAGRTVLEVACGTGYWTQFIAPVAHRVYAGDINEAVLEIAREKPIAPGKVTFMKADAVTLEGAPAGCNAALPASGGRT